MCKVGMVSGIKSNKINETLAFMQLLSGYMSVSNEHGLGYAAMTSEGKIFGERWLDNDDAWGSKEFNRVNRKFPGLISPPEKNSFGTISFGNMTTMMVHTRYATSPKGMNNTHPFVTPDNKTALIHNGVIRNDKDFNLTLSTCDSEAILVGYREEAVGNNPKNIQKLVDRLDGYYAVGILNSDTKSLDIMRAKGARLSFSFIEELQAFVFTTDGKDITSVCTDLGYSHGVIYDFKDEHFMRLDAITGDMLELMSITPYTAPVVMHNYRHGQANMGGWGEYIGGRKVSRGNTTGQMQEYMTHKPELLPISEQEVNEYVMRWEME